MGNWKGWVIAEGLSDPMVVNELSVYRVSISRDGIPVDYEGNVGRWHGYGVRCSREEIEALQPCILPGWYAHFWKGDRIVVLYSDRLFELARDDQSTWSEAIDHGKAQGIPEDELDFAVD